MGYIEFKPETKNGVMRLQLQRGCICGALTVDGKQEIDLTDEERQAVLDKIHETLKPDDLNYVLQALITEFGEYVSDDEPCECCGDYVEQYTWDLNSC